MSPPQHFSERWRRVWRHTLAYLQQRGSWRDDQRPLLDEYVEALREAAIAKTAARADPYRQTSSGSLQAHPGFAQADRAARRAVLLAGALRLTAETELHDADDFDGLDQDELASRRAARKR